MDSVQVAEPILDSFAEQPKIYLRDNPKESGIFTVTKGSKITAKIDRTGWLKNGITEFLNLDVYVSFDDEKSWQHFVGFGVTDDDTDVPESSITISIENLPKPFKVKSVIKANKDTLTAVTINIT